MKSLLERFTKWFNRTHKRSGTLWEDRYKSVIAEMLESGDNETVLPDLRMSGMLVRRVRYLAA